MKECGQEMKVILTVHGRERTFSERELIAILEKHFSKETTEQVSALKLAKVPTEGKLFEVKPLAINQTLFQKKRRGKRQEWTRKLILEAFAEVSKYPEKYASPFYTLIPEKKWSGRKTVAELKEYSKDLGGQMTDWVEQALEWAQRICNGESWKVVCNKADTANWYRLVVWKSGYTRLVGGSHNLFSNDPASYVFRDDCSSSSKLYYTVPLVTFKKKVVVH